MIPFTQLYFKMLPFSIYTGSIIGLCNGYNQTLHFQSNYNNELYIMGNGLYSGFVSIFYPVVLPILWYKSHEYYNNIIKKINIDNNNDK